MMAGFGSEYVASFESEWVAGFVGIRNKIVCWSIENNTFKDFA